MMMLLDATAAEEILKARRKGINEIQISLDLGVSSMTVDPVSLPFTSEDLMKISKDKDSLYFIEDKQVYKAAIRGSHFYKLIPTELGQAPALLIDGVLMHRVKGISPIEDAAMKASLCAEKDMDMLEICTGLGYASIECLKKGVRSIVTIEKEKEVIELAKLNPWSHTLFSDERVTIIQGDAVEEIKEFPQASFDAILHDPPRFSMGSELYTQDFYSELYRVLRPNGVLYHYVGTPGAKYRRIDIQKGVMNRLRSVGFKRVSREEKSQGVLARKR
jgi:predicted methyltransferase